MKTAQSSRILQLTKKLCAIPSVSGSAAEENRCADFITHCLFCLAQKHPGRVRVFEPVCERDPLERKAVFGLLRAAVPTDKTVVLTLSPEFRYAGFISMSSIRRTAVIKYRRLSI